MHSNTVIHLYNNIYALPEEGSGEKTHNDFVVKAFESAGLHVYRLEPGNASDSRDANEVRLDRKRQIYRRLKTLLPKAVTDYVRDFYNILHDYKFFDRVVSEIHELKPDFIFERITDFHAGGVKAAIKTGTPYVVEVHETHDALEYMQRMNFLWYRRYIWNHVINHADLVVVVSNMLKQQVIKSGVQEGRVLVLPNAVDLAVFSPRGQRESARKRFNIADEIVIGFVGGMHPYHGIQYLPEVCRRLMQQTENIRFLIVGPFGRMPGGVEAYEEELRSKGVSDKFILTGGVPLEDVPFFMEAMDIGIMPDSNDYGSPIKIFEYGAMRLATIAPAYGPIRDVLNHEQNAILFEPRSLDDMTEKLSDLILDATKRMRLANALYDKVVECHTWNANIDRLLSKMQENKLL